MNKFQQRHIKLIKSVGKDICDVTKDFHFNKFCIHQRILKKICIMISTKIYKVAQLFSTVIILRNVS